MNLVNKTIKMVGGIATNPTTGDVTGYATLRSLLENEYGLDPNLRDPVLGAIQDDLMKTLESDPKHFNQFNGGLMFTARGIKFTEKTGELTMKMIERGVGHSGFDDGQADGANSLFAAGELVNRLSKKVADAGIPDGERLAAEQKLRDVLDYAIFRVEVVVDLPPSRLPSVCAARNTNRKQKMTSMVNHEDGFNPLKVALGEVAKDVSFFEGDRRRDGSKKRIDVIELVRLAIASADLTPQRSYQNIGACPRRYQDEMATFNQRYIAATRNVCGLMTLMDAVDEAASKYVTKGTDSQRFLWGVQRPARGFQPRFGRAMENGLEYSVPDCFVLPVFSAVVCNLMRDDGSWIKDPLTYFRQRKGELLENVFGMYRKSKVGTTRFGGLPDVWAGLREAVSDTLRIAA